MKFTLSKNIRKYLCDDCFKKRKINHQEKYRNNNKELLKNTAKIYRSNNKDKRNRYNQKWYANRYPNGKIEYDLYHKYKLTWDQYQLILKNQNFSCGICKNPFGEKSPNVDHDHSCCPNKSNTCGKCTRGLLCLKCNTGLGMLKDSVEILNNAKHYLQNL